MSRVTGSRLPMLERCLFWARDDVEWAPEPEPSYEMSLGSAFHALLPALVGRKDADLVAVCEGIPGLVGYEDLAQLWDAACDTLPAALEGGLGLIPGTARYEKPYALNVVEGTAVELVLDAPRAYPPTGPGTVCLTADIVGESHDGGLVVVEVKTGSGYYTDPLPRNLQARAEAAAAAYSRKHRGEVTLALVHVSREDPGVRMETMAFGPMEARQTCADINALLAAVPTSEPIPGHRFCAWCPIAKTCPLAVEALAIAVPGEKLPALKNGRSWLSEYKLAGPIASPDEAAARVLVLPLLEAIVAGIKEGVQQYADEHGGILLPDGTVYRKTFTPTETLELNDTALELIRATVPGALKMTSSKSAIEDAMKKRDGTGKVAAAARKEMLEALRKTGALAYRGGRSQYKATAPTD